MINLKLKNRGESLPEVLVAVGILVVVLVVSLMLVSRGISTNISVKNKIIALNIAREGVEGMRNVRDTNWLRYSGDRRNKWLCWDKKTDLDCPENITTGGGYESYTIDFDNSASRFLLENPAEQSLLDLEVESAEDMVEYLLYKDSDNKYTHDDDSGANLETIFYRQLMVDGEAPPECDGVGLDNYSCDNPSRLHVISRVQWKEPLIAGDENASANSLIGTIIMETYLYDYLDRDEY